MNTGIKFLIIASAVFASAACTREEVLSPVESESIEITITAAREGYDPDTKTVTTDGYSVEWCLNEEISVFYANGTNGGSKFVSQNTEQAAIVEFKGRLEGFIAGGEEFTDGKYLYGVYPYSTITSFKDGVMTISLPSNQTGAEGTFANGLFPTIARAQSVNLAFYNICGGVKFTLSRDDITSVTFKGNNGERVAGTANVIFDESEKPAVLDENVGSEDEITLYAPEGGTFKAGKEYYIVAYPAALSAGFTMTFRTTGLKEGTYVRESAVEIERSTFSVLEQVDKNVTTWTDITSGGGGFNSGVYLGIMGFNQQLYPYPIYELTEGRKTALDNFIDDLNMMNGTLLYYSVEQALNTMQSTQLPDNISTAAIVTFTDGLDQGSMMMTDDYSNNTEYLNALNSRIMNDSVSGQPITAYSIGLRGNDVADEGMFSDNLRMLASADTNATEATSMEEVTDRFKEIAEQLSRSSYIQTINLTIPGQSSGTRIRFTFDNVPDAVNSSLYIEGTFNISTFALEDVVYEGLVSTSGTEVKATNVDGIFVSFTFEGVQTDDNTLIDSQFIDEWTYVPSVDIWQVNSEFDKTEDSDIITERSSAVIMLVLDCSSSLGDDFAVVQSNAKSFINTLYEAVSESGQPGIDDDVLYSTTPVDLSLAMWKDGVRYYLTEEEYQKANLSDAVIEGLTIVNGNESFILSLEDVQKDPLYGSWIAMEMYQDIMPTENQGMIISARWSDVNEAIKSFNGSQMSSSRYYYTSSTSFTEDEIFTNCIHGSGGSLGRTGSAPYVRGAKSTGYGSAIYWTDPDDLKLAVSINGERKLLSREEYNEWKGGIDINDMEGVVVIAAGEKFIVHLEDAQTDAISSIETAKKLYGSIMPTSDQAFIISAKWSEINTAISDFGGARMSTSYFYYTQATSSNQYYDYTYCINGGDLKRGYLFETNTPPHVRGVTKFE